ncbi:hypothetical protein J6590_077924 [Homalodisca vitripennis]|nr:hypothetical protein J6590_077924 [Homalodisca vitripennis]
MSKILSNGCFSHSTRTIGSYSVRATASLCNLPDTHSPEYWLKPSGRLSYRSTMLTVTNQIGFGILQRKTSYSRLLDYLSATDTQSRVLAQTLWQIEL